MVCLVGSAITCEVAQVVFTLFSYVVLMNLRVVKWYIGKEGYIRSWSNFSTDRFGLTIASIEQVNVFKSGLYH